MRGSGVQRALQAPRLEGATASTETITIISTNQFKNGNHIEVDGKIFKIVDFDVVAVLELVGRNNGDGLR